MRRAGCVVRSAPRILPALRLVHHGIVAFSHLVNVPVGPSRPRSATRTTSREPFSTDSTPAYPLRFVLVNPGETKSILMLVDSSSSVGRRRIQTLADQPERRTIGARSAINAQQTTTTINARVRVNACAMKPINGGPARSPA
ncbi:MAG: hypothetical protein QOI89_1189 [Solirubrobacteraceae bacterium]|nr:hypothetical protein [Solirubrobacteraceae bacterium]